MKYFTKEELAKISNELIENPTRETLKKLSEEYPLETVEKETVPISTTEKIPEEPPIKKEENNEVQTVTIPSITLNDTGSSQTNSNSSNVSMSNQNLNDNKVIQEKDLWNPANSEISNLMKPTDNFNKSEKVISEQEIPVTSGPFFGNSQQEVNNPIPISEQKNNGPSMFGQMQSNYNA